MTPMKPHAADDVVTVTRDDDATALESLAVMPAATADALRLRSGRTVAVDAADPDAITVRAPDGVIELSVRFTAEGPVLRFASAAVELTATRSVSVACETFSVRASGSARIEGDAVEIESTRGDVTVKANDDARIYGERVRLNG